METKNIQKLMRQLTSRRTVVSRHTNNLIKSTKATAITSKREVEQSAILELVEVLTKERALFVRRVLVIIKKKIAHQKLIFFFSLWFWRIQIWGLRTWHKIFDIYKL